MWKMQQHENRSLSLQNLCSMTQRLGLLLVVASVISTMPLERARAADYPVLYRDLGLPEYPQATVEAVGRSNSNLHDGLRIKLKTQASSIELRTFFEQKLTELGWVLQETAVMRKMRKAAAQRARTVRKP